MMITFNLYVNPNIPVHYRLMMETSILLIIIHTIFTSQNPTKMNLKNFILQFILIIQTTIQLMHHQTQKIQMQR